MLPGSTVPTLLDEKQRMVFSLWRKGKMPPKVMPLKKKTTLLGAQKLLNKETSILEKSAFFSIVSGSNTLL